MLYKDCAEKTDSPGCFKQPGQEKTLDWVMKKLQESYQILIGQIMAAGLPSTRIILHNYDYALPSGKGVFGQDSSWLRRSLDDAKVPRHLQAGCVRYVIDRLTVELTRLTHIDPSRIFLVDSRGCLEATEWANEIHPTPGGFRRIAEERWRPVLQKLNLAS